MSFYLGGPIDDAGERVNGNTFQYDPSDLTTHGVIVGMTGSGKTGLGIIFLEEALRAGIPTLVIDPKGDMTNLLLTFPDLSPTDFEPWVDAAAAEKDGRTSHEEATAEAAKWKTGLGWWDLNADAIASLRERAGMTIYTPGSNAANPLNIVGNLNPPVLSWDTDSETIRDEIEGFTSGLLGLIGIDADPISSREHILIANLVERAWREGTTLDIGTIITQIANPPMRKLGVFEVDQFFPEKDRMKLAMQLNGLLASPSFAAWMAGNDLDIESLLWKNGKPQAAIMYLAHLSDMERQFVVTMIYTRLITWMRSQPGSSDLRVLAYMDEVFGFVPPTAQPPAKKPILTLLKQARAFGVGMLLSTQNPVDLDYKAMSNAGTWCIGRLQTERDKARIIEALTTSSGAIDTAEMDTTISKLPKRGFVIHNTREKVPTTITTRWAMSYLRGPMTREEVSRFKDTATVKAAKPPSPAADPTPDPTSISGPTRTPEVAEGVASVAIHPAAPWRAIVGDSDAGTAYRAAFAVDVEMRFDESRIGVDHVESWEAIVIDPTIDDLSDLIEIDYDTRDFIEPDSAIPFLPTDVPISQPGFFNDLKARVKKHLDTNETLELSRNADLKLVSRPGEPESDFLVRCQDAANNAADAEKAKAISKYETRLRRVRRAYDDAVADASLAEQAAADEQRSALLGFGLDLLTGRKARLPGSRSRTTQDRARRAQSKIDSKRAEYEDLTAEMEDACVAIDDKWDTKVSNIEPVTIGLEADDIRVTDVKVVWIRT
ncbi:MAG: DUF87 domain-containing protein [Acidimicrobiia bacterium]|nr:DUF87 domain-containing protein [Acidimicrobiia bacterium]